MSEAKKIIKYGEYRAYDTGRLYNDIRYLLEIHTKDILYSAIGTFKVPYSVYVHEGTYLMRERPFLSMAFKRKMKVIIRIMENAIAEDLIKGFE